MFKRIGVWMCALLSVPGLLFAQALIPPPQDYVLHFQPNAVAYTDQIQLGAAFTMETWVFPNTPSPLSIIMGKPNNPRGSDPNIHYGIGFDATGRKPSFVQSTGQAGTYRAITGQSDLPLSSWTHLAATLNSGVMRLYVNGQLVASGASPGAPAGAAVPFGLGGGIPDGKTLCCGFSGALREARVWSRALSAGELQTYAVQRLTGNEAGLIAAWPLSEGSGSVIHGVGPRDSALTTAGRTMWSQTKWLDSGPYWETTDLPPLTDGPYVVEPVPFLNPDHRLDLLLAYSPPAQLTADSGPVLFLHNEGKRVFSPVKPIQPTMMSGAHNYAVADFDGDGYEDAVVAASGLDAPPYPGAITPIFIQRSGAMKDETASRFPPGVAFTHDLCSADINRDGSPDLLLANLFRNGLDSGPVMYLNDGKGYFRIANEFLPPIFSTSATPNFLSCRFVDVNRDGAPDLLLGEWPKSQESQGVRDRLLLNDGKGNFRDVTIQSMPLKRGGLTWSTLGFAVADVNRDGWPDLIVTMAEFYNRSTMQLLINNRDGTFHEQLDTALNEVRTGGAYYDKAYGVDLNQDGWPDLVLNEGGVGRVQLYQNMGGHFEDRTETLSLVAALEWFAGRPGDFDGDGRIDIALFSGTTAKIAWGKNLWPPVATSTPVVTSVNMAGGFPGITQNGWIEIKGTNLTPENVGPGGMTWSDAREFAVGVMPAYLAGISVTVNGKPAFVYYVSPTQLNVLSPIDSTIGTARIVVTSGGLSSLPFNADMRVAAPSFPLFGVKYLVATHADNTLVGPASLSAPGYPITPARPSETIVLYGFGFGLPTTTLVNGASSQSGRLLELPVIQFGGIGATVVFAGVISPGLYQFNVVVPGTAEDGDSSVSASYKGAAAPSGGLIAIKR
jgi:uncharacterized protein (TIGR03437 family)